MRGRSIVTTTLGTGEYWIKRQMKIEEARTVGMKRQLNLRETRAVDISPKKEVLEAT